LRLLYYSIIGEKCPRSRVFRLEKRFGK